MLYRVLISLFLLGIALPTTPAFADSPSSLQTPSLKWTHGGCHEEWDWCETGWYSSPAVADLDGDGQAEVVAAGYSVFALDGATGQLEWRVAAGDDRSQTYDYNGLRTHPGIVIVDVDDDDQLEIITSHDGGYVSVYNSYGYFEPGWPKRPTNYELYGLAAYDLDDDGQLEIIVTADVLNHVNTWVFEPDGSLRPGWPQWPSGADYVYGTFSDNVAVGDLDGDGMGDILVPSDINNTCAYKPNGQQLAANEMYSVSVWGYVNTFESLVPEIRGWSSCKVTASREERNIANFDNGMAVIADVNGDGINETVVSSNIYDCAADRRPTLFHTIYIFNADRSQFNVPPYDWQTPVLDVGSPLSEDFDVIRDIRPSPVVADLDGNGQKEILLPSFDGKLHAFWLDKTEHGNWPYSVYNPQEGSHPIRLRTGCRRPGQ